MNDNQQPIINMLGENVALGPHRRELLPLTQRWINDFAALRTLGALAPGPSTIEAQEAYYDRVTAATAPPFFIIYERATWRPVGSTGFHELDHRNRSAVFGILVGEPDARGKGYGTEATRLMLDYAFTALGLHSVMLTVAEFNRAGRRAYAKAGFREFGRRRECRWLAGKLWDEIYMDCLATEFASPILAHILTPDPPRNTEET